MSTSVFFNEKNTEKTLIESILSSFYIIDYGYIKTVNADETIDVVHAKKLKLINGKELNQTITKSIEVLTLCGSGFSFKFDYKKGDKVLLLGLKNYIKNVKDVTQATETTSYQHYTRETLKAIPLCVFNGDAKVTMEIKDGNIITNAKGKVSIASDQNTELNAKGKITANGTTIELNGNTKKFVTWAELNTALSTYVTNLNAALAAASVKIEALGVIVPVTMTTPPPPAAIDISAAMTTTVATGG